MTAVHYVIRHGRLHSNQVTMRNLQPIQCCRSMALVVRTYQKPGSASQPAAHAGWLSMRGIQLELWKEIDTSHMLVTQIQHATSKEGCALTYLEAGSTPACQACLRSCSSRSPSCTQAGRASQAWY